MKKKISGRSEDRKGKEKPEISKTREYYEALLVAVIFASFVKVFIFQTYQIPTPSMVPTILVGDHMIVNKFIYPARALPFMENVLPLESRIDRGDIVVIKGVEDPKILLVKRVIGLPGEIISGSGTTIYINGKPLEEPWARYEAGGRPGSAFGPLKIANGAYFVMGDNRDNSWDSRGWGTVTRDRVIGKPWITYWSYEAPPYNPNATFGQKVKNFLSVIPNFFTKTRWERTFTIPK